MPVEPLGGHRIFWQHLGAAAPGALLIHPSLAHSGAWRHLAEALGPGFGALAPDLPGHGRSADWNEEGDYHDAATRIAQDLLARCERPALLIGHSFGATVALRLALEDPQSVRALVLIEPVLFAALRGTDGFGRALEEQKALEELARKKGARAAAKAFMESWGTGIGWDDMPEEQRAQAARRMPLIAASAPALYEDRAGLLQPGRLEALQRPCLLLEGADSPPEIGAISHALAARLPDARRSIVAGAAHMLPITHPRECAREIGRFLADLPEAQAG